MSLTDIAVSLRLAPSQFVIPEYIAHGFLVLLFLLSGQFMALALNLPLVAYNVRK